MLYVYDTILEPGQTTFKRYGINYKLERRFKMGSFMYYSFVHAGVEKVLVVPYFATKFRKLEAKIAKYKPGRSLEEYMGLIRRDITKNYEIEVFPCEESKSGISQMITLDCDDIGMTLEYVDGQISIHQEFEIKDNNIFGNGIVVSMNADEEDH